MSNTHGQSDRREGYRFRSYLEGPFRTLFSFNQRFTLYVCMCVRVLVDYDLVLSLRTDRPDYRLFLAAPAGPPPPPHPRTKEKEKQ